MVKAWLPQVNRQVLWVVCPCHGQLSLLVKGKGGGGGQLCLGLTLPSLWRDLEQELLSVEWHYYGGPGSELGPPRILVNWS